MAADLVSLNRCNFFPQIAEVVGLEGGFCVAELTPFAILVSALIALIVGWLGWRGNRKLTREQAAITLILEREMVFREDFRSLWMMIQKHQDNENFFRDLAQHYPVGIHWRTWEQDRDASKLPIDQRQWLTVSACLQYYEAIAVAVERGAIDKKTTAKFLKEKFVYYIDALYPFILEVRNETSFGRADTWIAAEKLAETWGATLPGKYL